MRRAARFHIAARVLLAHADGSDAMKISVVVPSLNYGRFLASCIKSILMQDYTNFELLVCDAGSKDDSLSVIESAAYSDRRISLVSQSDTGQADAIDRAFRAATGQIFCYLNADDVLLANNAFSLAIEGFSENPDVGIICFRSAFIDVDGNILRPVKLRMNPFDELSWIKHRGQVVQPSAFWRREVYLACPFRTDWHYCFDSAFFYEAYQRFRFMERPEIISGYRLHGSNKSMGVSWRRIVELSEFEAYKFGPSSFRASYLRFVAATVRSAGTVPVISSVLLRSVYLVVNSLSFLSWYRLPSI
jgi:glycosyltransferase involved in cell wall biosynthesis